MMVTMNPNSDSTIEYIMPEARFDTNTKPDTDCIPSQSVENGFDTDSPSSTAATRDTTPLLHIQIQLTPTQQSRCNYESSDATPLLSGTYAPSTDDTTPLLSFDIKKQPRPKILKNCSGHTSSDTTPTVTPPKFTKKRLKQPKQLFAAHGKSSSILY